MTEIPHLDQLALVLVAGVTVALLLARLRLPTTAGLLVAGAVVGPYGTRLLRDPEAIQSLAEIGVVLLLFTIGLEFSISRLRFIGRQVVVGGSLQVGLTIITVLVGSLLLGLPWERGLFLGFLFALSSTAIVLRSLADRGEIDAPHGRLVVGVLIFQDLCVVPMMLVVPLLAGQHQGSVTLAMVTALGKAAAIVIAALGASRLVITPLLASVSRARDLFVLAVIGLCIAIAWLTALAGLSLALGAFLAGLIMADTQYGHRALGEVLPMRDVFSSLFFMSMGMFFDPRVLLDAPLAVGLLLGTLVLAKGLLATVAALAMRFPVRVAWLAGVGLAQFGEFGFVLATVGERAGLLSAQRSHEIFTAGVLSMFLTPILVRLAPRVRWVEKMLGPIDHWLELHPALPPEERATPIADHVVIIGYGTTGRLLAGVLDDSHVRYVAVDLDAGRVQAARVRGEKVDYGDGTSRDVLLRAGVARARLVVVLINDRDAARRTIAGVRELAPGVVLMARSPGPGDSEELRNLGVDHVVTERIEAGLEVTGRVLRHIGLPGEVIAAAIDRARQGSR